MKHLGILINQIHFSNKVLSKHFQSFTEIPISQGLLLPKEEISGKKIESKKAERRKLKLKDKKSLWFCDKYIKDEVCIQNTKAKCFNSKAFHRPYRNIMQRFYLTIHLCPLRWTRGVKGTTFYLIAAIYLNSLG